MTPQKKRTVALVNAKLPRYAGKALKPGQQFHALEKDARLLTLAKLATYDTTDQARQPAIAKPLQSDDQAELLALRADYEALSEKKPLGFWKADKLRAEIDKLRSERDATLVDEAPSAQIASPSINENATGK